MSYKILRCFFEENHPTEVIKSGLTLGEAREWCDDEETSSVTCTNPIGEERTRTCGPWFDGYEEE